jgi:hypothetical protein
VTRQVGYSIADVLAKPLFGLLVLAIALLKSRQDGYAELGESRTGVTAPDDSGSVPVG